MLCYFVPNYNFMIYQLTKALEALAKAGWALRALMFWLASGSLLHLCFFLCILVAEPWEILFV